MDGKGQAVARPPGFFAATQDGCRRRGTSSRFSDRRAATRWTDSDSTLVALAEDAASGDPYDGFLLRYNSPTDGGPTLPTFSCEIQLLTPGIEAPVHRHNNTAISYVVRGEGRTEVAGEWLDWSRGAIIPRPAMDLAPPREPLQRSRDPLFGRRLAGQMAKMGFYRKEGGASE